MDTIDSGVIGEYRCGLFLNVGSDTPAITRLEDAEQMARAISERHGNALVAVWDQSGNTLKLFVGDQEFKKIQK